MAGSDKDVLNENFKGLLKLQKNNTDELSLHTDHFNYPIYEFEKLGSEKKIINIDEIGIPFNNTFTIQLPGKEIVYEAEQYTDSLCHKLIINGHKEVVKFNKKGN
ncbi:MAG: hypothetical protein IPF62_10980 [Bacteroidetes bacterium]|nr:hypothetical protein [Bacteroidota bacterium]